ncbi:hypothetical protein CW749_07520 [Vibrio sp. vnigr-6D03]|nr:hypothetical protein CW749_07520 [Vibrio sp. vnigr-6D03]
MLHDCELRMGIILQLEGGAIDDLLGNRLTSINLKVGLNRVFHVKHSIPMLPYAVSNRMVGNVALKNIEAFLE